MKKLLGLWLLATPTALPAMPVSEFLAKAEALKAKGAMALFSSDVKLLKKEMEPIILAYEADNAAARKAGKPLSCPPEKPRLNLIEDFRAIPPG